MKCSWLGGFLTAAALVSTTAPSLSDALNSSPLPDSRSIVRVMAQYAGENVRYDDAGNQPAFLAQADFDRDDDGAGPPDAPHTIPRPGLHIATKLAVAETYIGITSGQLDAWRGYATALIELVDRSELDGGLGEARDEGLDETPPTDGRSPLPAEGLFFAERLVDLAIARGEKARVLKEAITTLRPVLTPAQILKLREAEWAFLPPSAPLGPGGPDDERAERHYLRYDELPPPPFGE